MTGFLDRVLPAVEIRPGVGWRRNGDGLPRPAAKIPRRRMQTKQDRSRSKNGIDILRSTIRHAGLAPLVLAVVSRGIAGVLIAISGAGGSGLMRLMPDLRRRVLA